MSSNLKLDNNVGSAVSFQDAVISVVTLALSPLMALKLIPFLKKKILNNFNGLVNVYPTSPQKKGLTSLNQKSKKPLHCSALIFDKKLNLLLLCYSMFQWQLKIAIKIGNVDKYAVCVKKNASIVGHLLLGKSEKFAKVIFYLLRGDQDTDCKVTITGKEVNLGHGKGMQLPCKLKITVPRKMAETICKNIQLYKREQIKDCCYIYTFSSTYWTNNPIL